RVALYEYDAENNVVAETDARGARTTYRHDGLGRPVAMRDALGRETRVTYDAKGQRTSVTLPDGARTSFAYDAAGHLTRVTDALGRTTRYVYTGFHALSRVVGPDGWTWKVDHTKEERVRCITNPLGEEYRFERDLAGRVVSEKTFDGRELRYERDAAGRVARIVHPDGDGRIFGYDRAGRLVRDGTREDRVHFARDPFGRLLSATLEDGTARHETRFERDAFGRLVGESQGDRRIRYGLDVLGRRTLRVLPNGATTRYAYDALDALVSVDHDGFELTFERDAVGRETARAHRGGLRVASRYDEADRLVEQKATAPGADGGLPRVLVDRRWRYDRIGRVERIDDARWGATTYKYDPLDQLLEARRGMLVEAFTYDQAGSIVSALEQLDGARREAKHDIHAGNVLLKAGNTKYGYDKRGRRIGQVTFSKPDSAEKKDVVSATEYAWNARDQLTQATKLDGTRVSLSYDALGRRVRKEVTPRGSAQKPRVTDYVWDGDVLAMQVDSAEGLRAFVHAPGTFLPLLQQQIGQVFTYMVDQMGTAKELLTADGLVAWSAAHSAWGSVVAEHADASERSARSGPVSSPFRLLGQIADDELGLCFTRFRLFDPAVGRWLSPDPLGLGGGKNLFAFDGAASLTVDPWGLAAQDTVSQPHPAAEGGELSIDPTQLGKKFGQHRDPTRAGYRSPQEYAERAQQIYADPSATRTTFGPSGPYSDETHVQLGDDLLRLDPEGHFRSLYPVTP
ncbi:MAG: RHS repeat-associated core domain-containing protein, partial [Polyangiaceae bacterium]